MCERTAQARIQWPAREVAVRHSPLCGTTSVPLGGPPGTFAEFADWRLRVVKRASTKGR